MRKGFFALIAGITLLTACGTAATAPPQTTQLSCNFTATYRDLQLAGTLERLRRGTLTLSLTAPTTLSGLQLSWNGEKATVRFQGAEYTLPSKLPQTAAARLIADVLDDAAGRAADAVAAGEEQALVGTVGTYRYRFCCDKGSGLPLLLEIPDAALSVRFDCTAAAS